jgi:hypothetical protein
MFNPFGWASQIRFRQKLSDKISLDLVAYKDREFTASSVTGTAPNAPTLILPFLLYTVNFNSKTKNNCRIRCRISIFKTCNRIWRFGF